MSFHTDTRQTDSHSAETTPEPTKRNPWLQFAIMMVVVLVILGALITVASAVIAVVVFNATDTSVGEDISSYATTILHDL